jgi:hypothetical protein
MEHEIGTFTVRLLGDGGLEVRSQLTDARVWITDGIFDDLRVYAGHPEGMATYDQVTLHAPGGLIPGAHFTPAAGAQVDDHRA